MGPGVVETCVGPSGVLGSGLLKRHVLSSQDRVNILCGRPEFRRRPASAYPPDFWVPPRMTSSSRWPETFPASAPHVRCPRRPVHARQTRAVGLPSSRHATQAASGAFPPLRLLASLLRRELGG